MKSICFYFQIHQPYRLRTYRFFDIGRRHDYYDEQQNRYIINKVAEKSYLPANEMMLELIRKHGKSFRIAYSISGLALDQFEEYKPEVIESFKKLADTGQVEFLSETYAHSLASLKSPEEFKRQVEKHKEKIQTLFGVEPKTFRNTELIYSDKIGKMVYDMGYRTMLTEGARHVLGWKSPGFLYVNSQNPKLKVLLKNFRLSDDIAFRFSDQSWDEWPLTAEKFVNKLKNLPPEDEVVNLFMDYETFGEHQWKETGIFEFLKALPEKVLKEKDLQFRTPAEAAKELQPVSAIHVPNPISWADEERDLTAWLGNELQDEAFDKLYALEEKVKDCNDKSLEQDWQYLQASDHFYYMCTKWFSDGAVHHYFNPYKSPYEGFINYMNVISDFIMRVEEKRAAPQTPAKTHNFKPGDQVSRQEKTQKPDTFNDLKKVPKKVLKEVLRGLAPSTLAMALANTDRDLYERLLSVMGKRAQKAMEDDKPIKLTATDKSNARQVILDSISDYYDYHG
ncbi:MAG: FliG C-terminal domain-containing protein [Bacteroidota bacterium]